ncbi:MAG: ATP-binding protein [Actinomycetota bacterium]
MTRTREQSVAVRGYVAVLSVLFLVVLGRSMVVGGFSTAPLIWVCLTILFWTGETLGVQFHHGKQSVRLGTGESFIIPMLLELTYSQVVWSIPAAMLASMRLRRVKGPIKYLFNASVFGLATAGSWLIWDLLGDGSGRLTGRNAAVGAVVICFYAVSTTVAVELVISLVEKRPFGAIMIGDQVETVLNVSINIVFGLLFAAAYSGTRWSLLLFVLPLMLMHFGYRAIVRQRSEHARMEQVHAASSALTAEADLPTALVSFLRAVADAASASEARAVIKSHDGVWWCGVRDGGIVADMEPVEGGPMRELWERSAVGDRADLESPALMADDLLGALGARSVLAVPLTSGSDSAGYLLAMDRIGADDFGPLDHRLLQALAEQLSLALASRDHQRILESRLAHAQKLEAVGRLAGGVAHEFNNLLAIIQNYVSFVADELEKTDPKLADLQEALVASNRAHKVTRQLLTFSRQDAPNPEVWDLNDVVRDAEKLLRRTIGEDVEVSTELAPDLWPVKIDRGLLEQVLLNLAVNARAAMPKGGKLGLHSSNLDPERTLEWPKDLSRDQYVAIGVTDTGQGMKEEVRARIFEPFFTTKPKGEGTGLGLSIVYGIVKEAGGDIIVSSTVGAGTEFVIYLPRTTDEAVTDLQRPSSPQGHVGSARVLIVEDEDGVREVARRVLVRHGYDALVARSGDEALALLNGGGVSVDLLLTDVVMPGISGKELVDLVRRRHPRIKAAFMSGYADEHMGADIAAEEEVLEKPFSAEELLLFVQGALEEG